MVMSILLWSCADDEEIEIENFEPYFYISFIDVANPGVVKIDTLFVVGSNGYILFEDSSDIFDFPLPVTAKEAIYKISMLGKTNSLSLSWNSEIIPGIGQIDFIISNIKIEDHSTFYDSVRVECDSLCLSNETIIKAYY
jgi:hypothetical protein